MRNLKIENLSNLGFILYIKIQKNGHSMDAPTVIIPLFWDSASKNYQESCEN